MELGPPLKPVTLARRALLKLAAGCAAIIAGRPSVFSDLSESTLSRSAQDATPTPSAPAPVAARMTVNGAAHDLDLDPRTSLLDALREELGLTGAKKGCDHGQCGACTVHLDGQRVASCLMMAVQADGREVVTIEGLAGPDGALHPMQLAFIENDALQCGYCTPGQVMAAVACVQEGNVGSDDAIREAMSGNLCRCGCYVGIVAAVAQAAPQMER